MKKSFWSRFNYHERRRRKLAADLESRCHSTCDLLTPEELAAFRTIIAELKSAADPKAATAAATAAYQAAAFPGRRNSFGDFLDLLAVVGAVAFGIRALFLQPFQIPTGSMQPTLYGRHYLASDAIGRPGVGRLGKPIDFALYGVLPAHETVRRSGTLEMVRELGSWIGPRAQLRIAGELYELPGDAERVAEYAGIPMTPPQWFASGQALGDGYWSLGDHLFVERLSLYLRPVRRGDVMVFSTQGLADDQGKALADEGFYYIKRVAALPKDTVKIINNQLYVRPDKETKFYRIQELAPEFAKVYSQQGGYQGHVSGMGSWDFAFGQAYTLPDDAYLMLGDNSRFSKDSRYFGPVPHRNLIGRAFFVFWPFSRRWGLADRNAPLPEPTGDAALTTFPVMWKQ